MQRNMAMALPCRSPSSHKHPKWQQQGEKPHFPHMPTRSEIAHGALAPSHEHIQSFPSAHSWAELLTPHPGHLTMVKGDRSTNPMVTMTEQPPYASLGFSQPLDQQSSLFSPRKVLPSISYSQGVIKVAGKAKHSLFAWRWYLGVSKVGDRCWRLSCYCLSRSIPHKSGESLSVRKNLNDLNF